MNMKYQEMKTAFLKIATRHPFLINAWENIFQIIFKDMSADRCRKVISELLSNFNAAEEKTSITSKHSGGLLQCNEL